MFSCLECGRRFKTAAAAERAADLGCPKCGGVDIDCETMFAFGKANPDIVKSRETDATDARVERWLMRSSV